MDEVNDKKKKVNIYVSEELYEESRKVAKKLGISFSGLVNISLHDRLRQDNADMFVSLEEKLKNLGLQIKDKN